MNLAMNSRPHSLMRMSSLILVLVIGCSSLEISASKKSCKYCGVVPHLAKTVAWGAVTICSAYLIYTNAKEALKLFKGSKCLDKLILELLEKGCVIAGLAMLLYKAAISTKDNFERL